ncbi:hypothetical protein KC340_g10737, partial [Hortaea werneckii]
DSVSSLNSKPWQPLWASASLAGPYQQYSLGYGGRGSGQHDTQQTPVTSTSYDQLLTQGFHPQDQQYTQAPQQTAQAYHNYAVTPMLPSQVSAPEPNYNTEQAPMLSSQMQRTMSMSQVSSSQYGTPYESPEMMRYQTATSASRKRSLPEDYYDYQRTQPVHANASNPNASAQPAVSMQSGYSQVHPSASSYYLSSQHPYSQGEAQIYQPPVHHHHRLPNHPPPSKSQRLSDAGEEHTSVVGQPGMPSPAARPKGPKLKFTAEDDALLVELKETKNLTWKQIADFFPGRSSGTLQVRYCTKLKAKTTTWTDDMVQRLRTASAEYEVDRWRVISSKVGNGFSAAACKEKAMELEAEEGGPLASTATGLVRRPSTASSVDSDTDLARGCVPDEPQRVTEIYDYSRRAEGCNFESTNEPLGQRGIDFRHDTLVA